MNVKPIDSDRGDLYTRCRIIMMNGIEVEAIMFSHQFARHTIDPDIKRQLAHVIEHRKAESIVDRLTEVMPGRPSSITAIRWTPPPGL
ncbi:hypothetical protein ABZT27_28640 [Streptomyces sp. NPDC005389]|uniref:hypothetical protein n=1 Tax=Streptomyces sp. NPDC005389 TaxID=3157040 RepID=UPI0033A0BDB0